MRASVTAGTVTDGDRLNVAGEEDGGLVFIAFFGELGGSDVGGVAHGVGDGVRGVNGGGDESLGDRKSVV